MLSAANKVVVPLRLYSCVIVPQRPFFIGRPGCVRSRAWIWLFSSTHKTRDLSGGLRYRPTMSQSFSTKFLSRLSLKVSTRCGLRLCCFHMRRTVASLTPCALAIVRVLQCVALAGLVCSVASTRALIFRGAILGMRPGRGASFSSPGKRSAKKRCRQSCTVGLETPKLRAMSWLNTPSAAIRMICARCTNRTGKILPRTQVSNIDRSWADKTIGGALLLMRESISILVAYVKLFVTHYTSAESAGVRRWHATCPTFGQILPQGGRAMRVHYLLNHGAAAESKLADVEIPFE